MIKIEKSSAELALSEASFCRGTVTAWQADSTTSENDLQVKKCVSDTYTEIDELLNKYSPKKTVSQLLSDSYARIGLHDKSFKVSDCGTFLVFAHEIFESGVVSEVGKLHNANFCHDRLCPMCSMRRSLKIYSQVSQIMEHIKGQYKYLFITLTVPNVPACDLSSAISRMMKAWNLLLGYKAIRSIRKGYFRALEITRNSNTGFYHPHFHIVLAVPSYYGSSSSYYLSHDLLLSLWRRAYNDNSITQVDIRLAKNKYKENSDNINSAIAEIAKYAVKDSDYIIRDNEALTDSIVSTLYHALISRRLISYGGIFKKALQELKLEDVESESADLTHLEYKLNPTLAWLICRYGWSAGLYNMIDYYVEPADKHN